VGLAAGEQQAATTPHPSLWYAHDSLRACLFGLTVGRSDGWSVGLLVGRSVVRTVGGSFGRSDIGSVWAGRSGRSIGRLVGRSVGESVHRCVGGGGSVGSSVCWAVGMSSVWCVAQLLDRSLILSYFI
jgi:hypothetical protein